ncbi:MAG: RNA polymerase sigma factor [Sedimentisphaerales bacterium]|nr:RNA polymerase sigma factor [Sedimentisphaerales bacterium]
MKDKLLVMRCKRGNAEALERIYEKYKKDMLVLAVALLHNTSAAEDVVHDVFTCFVRDIERFRLTGSLKSYLLTCVANRARNTNKAKHLRAVESDLSEPFGSDEDNPSAMISCNEQLQQLSSAMTRLPYDQRETIMLHFQAGFTFKEIADSLGVSVNTVKSRYRYGIDRLRSILDGEVIK